VSIGLENFKYVVVSLFKYLRIGIELSCKITVLGPNIKAFLGIALELLLQVPSGTGTLKLLRLKDVKNPEMTRNIRP